MEKATRKSSEPQLHSDERSEGRSMAPPPFQLKASEGVVQRATTNKDRRDKRDAKKRHVRSKASRYFPGQHGAKKREQLRLSRMGQRVTGDTHESEHIVGFEPLARTAGGKRGKGERNRRLENTAPAYQEIKLLHRDNIGTGTHSEADASGFNSESYRDTQRSFLEQGEVGIAMQLNQLTYAFQDQSQVRGTVEERQSNDSFAHMIRHSDAFTFAEGDQDKVVPMSPSEKFEVLVARFSMKNQRLPNNLERHHLSLAASGIVEIDASIFDPKSEDEAIRAIEGEDEPTKVTDDEV
ncbi:MAG: hypothetical protein U0176_24995 [Bacteroidia bacterium]